MKGSTMNLYGEQTTALECQSQQRLESAERAALAERYRAVAVESRAEAGKYEVALAQKKTSADVETARRNIAGPGFFRGKQKTLYLGFSN